MTTYGVKRLIQQVAAIGFVLVAVVLGALAIVTHRHTPSQSWWLLIYFAGLSIVAAIITIAQV